VIFVTVGTQLGFDRMIRAVDSWAALTPGEPVFAQIGPGAYLPRHMEYAPFVDPDQCRERMLTADAIVAHAGMGTILGALEIGKPLLVMPRRAALGEHRNDHQIATARRFGDLGRVTVAGDEHDLQNRLNDLSRLTAAERISPFASDQLIDALSTFINR
jgi:UDP-N-acetylglucosamine transferase subunit ALG13